MKRRHTSRVLRACFALALGGALVAACNWDPSRPFDRQSPVVDEAIKNIDGGDARAAETLLEEYLATGACEGGSIGVPPTVRSRPFGSFDLGIALFKIAESYGARFGDEEKENEKGAESKADPKLHGLRSGSVECARRVVRAVAEDTAQPIDLRARARYLEGNLLFLNGDYEEAVRAYDSALELAPGLVDGGPIGVAAAGRVYKVDPVGADAAYNRAIALRRIDDKKDAGKDAADDAANDASSDSAGGEGGSGDSGGGDSGQDSGRGGEDAGKKNEDAGQPPESQPDAGSKPPPPPEDAGPPRASQDDRILDRLANAPTLQQELAKKASKAQKRPARGAADR